MSDSVCQRETKNVAKGELKGFLSGFLGLNLSGRHMYAIPCKASYEKNMFSLHGNPIKCFILIELGIIHVMFVIKLKCLNIFH